MANKESTIRILRVIPGEEPVVAVIQNTLEVLQEEVGGYIEQVRLDGMTVICNEDGHSLQLPKNVCGLLGTILIVGVRRDEYCSLTDAEITSACQWLATDGRKAKAPLN